MSTTDTDNKCASHWHVVRHSDDDDPFVTYDTVAALDYARGEVDHHAERAHETATLAFEAQEWEESATAFVASERFALLSQSMHVVVRNAAMAAKDRAPLYRDEAQYGPLWTRSFAHALDTFRTDGPDALRMWECTQQWCRPGAWQIRTWGDFTSLSVVGAYPAVDYRDAFARYATTAREWADSSDEEYNTPTDPENSNPDDYGTDRDTVDSILSDQDSDPRGQDHHMFVHSNNGETMHFALVFDPTHELED